MAGISLDVEVGEDGTVELKGLKKALDEVGDEAEKTGRRGSKALKRMRNMARKTYKAVGMIATKGAMIIGVLSGIATAGFGLLLREGLRFNATLEAIKTQLGVIYNDTKRAGRAMKELVDFASTTPYGLADLANSAKILEAFGIGGSDSLRMVGDAAAAAQRPLEEVAMTFGRIKSGAFGEAFMRLAEMGLATREMLEAEGLVFNRSGSYVGSVDDAMGAVTRIMNRRFAGMMEKLSETWNGKISTMKDAFSIMAGTAAEALFYGIKPVLDRLITLMQRPGVVDGMRNMGARIAMSVHNIIDPLLKKIESLSEEDIRNNLAAIGALVGRSMEAVVNFFYTAARLAYHTGRLIFFAIRDGLQNVWDVLQWKSPRGFEDTVNEWADVQGAVAGANFAQKFMQGIAEYKLLKSGLGGILVGGGETGAGPGLDADAERIDREAELAEQIATLWRGHRALQVENWKYHWTEIGAIAEEAFGDAVTAQILEKGNSLKEALDSIWQQMKYSMVRTFVQMGIDAAKQMVKTAIMERSIRKKAAADMAADAGVQAGAYRIKTSAAAGTAAAKYHAAHAYIPFGGAAIASGYISAMTAQIKATEAVTMAMRTGGLVPGGGSGAEDAVPAMLSGGEYVLNAQATRALGTEFLDSVNMGLPAGGGGSSLNVNVYGGGGITEEEVEEELVGLLERLSERGRFTVSAA